MIRRSFGIRRITRRGSLHQHRCGLLCSGGRLLLGLLHTLATVAGGFQGSIQLTGYNRLSDGLQRRHKVAGIANDDAVAGADLDRTVPKPEFEVNAISSTPPPPTQGAFNSTLLGGAGFSVLDHLLDGLAVMLAAGFSSGAGDLLVDGGDHLPTQVQVRGAGLRLFADLGEGQGCEDAHNAFSMCSGVDQAMEARWRIKKRMTKS